MNKVKYYCHKFYNVILLLFEVVVTLIGGLILFIILRFLGEGLIQLI